jgi:hypothetical protein
LGGGERLIACVGKFHCVFDLIDDQGLAGW